MNKYIDFLNQHLEAFEEIEQIELGTNPLNDKLFLSFHLSQSDIQFQFNPSSISRMFLSAKLDKSGNDFKAQTPSFDNIFNTSENYYFHYFYFECKEGDLAFRLSDSDASQNKLMKSYSLFLNPYISIDLLKNICICFNKIIGEYSGNVQVLKKEKEHFSNLFV